MTRIDDRLLHEFRQIDPGNEIGHPPHPCRDDEIAGIADGETAARHRIGDPFALLHTEKHLGFEKTFQFRG